MQTALNALVASCQLLVSRNFGTEKTIPAIVSYSSEGDKLEDALETNYIGFLLYFLVLNL